MSTRNYSLEQRLKLSRTFIAKKLSENCVLKIMLAIGSIRESKGHEKAEIAAQIVTQMLEDNKPEMEIIQSLESLSSVVEKVN